MSCRCVAQRLTPSTEFRQSDGCIYSELSEKNVDISGALADGMTKHDNGRPRALLLVAFAGVVLAAFPSRAAATGTAHLKLAPPSSTAAPGATVPVDITVAD